MFSLHLYKNTEYSRVFTQSGNSYICFFLAPRLIFLPRAIWFVDCSLDGSESLDWTTLGRPRRPTWEQYLRAVMSLNSCVTMQGLPPPHTYRLWEAPTQTGTWETVCVFFIFSMSRFVHSLHLLGAPRIHRLRVNTSLTCFCFRSFVVAKTSLSLTILGTACL